VSIGVFDPLAGLIARAVRGERPAAGHLVDAVSPQLWRIAWRLLPGDTASAEDAVQETLVRMWRQLPDWQPGRARLTTWLHQVVTNICLDRLRRTGRTVPDTEAPDHPDPGPGALLGLERDDARARVDAALAGLPDRQRAAIVLVHFEELPAAAAAVALEISVEALESLLARARRSLRTSLAADRADLLQSFAGETQP
jgi:RNA polymerase sigma-70 factor, ECF subfamily